MEKTSLAFLAVLVWVLTFTPIISASAGIQSSTGIIFQGYARGSCTFMMATFPPTPGELPVYGLASGNIALRGYANAPFHEPINNDIFLIYGMAYFTAPGGVKALGSLMVRWVQDYKQHLLWVTIYSKPTSEGIFQPETDKFVAGIPPTGLGEYPPGFEGRLLSFTGVHRTGSNLQYLSGSTAVWVAKAEPPHPLAGTEIIVVAFMIGEYAMEVIWFSETVSISWGGPWITVPAATTLVRDVEFL